MLVKITRDCQGAPDRVRTFKFAAGNVVDISEELAAIFIDQGCAIPYSEKDSDKDKPEFPPVPEQKVAEVESQKSVPAKGNKVA